MFTNLMHLIDQTFLWEAYRLIRKDGASGVDGVTGREYAEDLAENLRKLHELCTKSDLVATGSELCVRRGRTRRIVHLKGLDSEEPYELKFTYGSVGGLAG